MARTGPEWTWERRGAALPLGRSLQGGPRLLALDRELTLGNVGSMRGIGRRGNGAVRGQEQNVQGRPGGGRRGRMFKGS